LQVFFLQNDYDLAFEFHVNKSFKKYFYPPKIIYLLVLLFKNLSILLLTLLLCMFYHAFTLGQNHIFLIEKKLLKKLCINDMLVYLQAFMAITFHFILLLFTNIDFNFQIVKEKLV